MIREGPSTLEFYLTLRLSKQIIGWNHRDQLPVKPLAPRVRDRLECLRLAAGVSLKAHVLEANGLLPVVGNARTEPEELKKSPQCRDHGMSSYHQHGAKRLGGGRVDSPLSSTCLAS